VGANFILQVDFTMLDYV